MKRLSCSDAGCLYLMALASFVAILIMLAIVNYSYAEKPVGAPPSSPTEAKFFKSAINSMRGSCCDEGDGYREGLKYKLDHVEGDPRVMLIEWKATPDKPGEYDVNVLGKWMHVNKDHVVACGPQARDQNGALMGGEPRICNPTGGAVVWLAFEWRNVQMNQLDKLQPSYVRCFAPGNMF